MKVYKIVLTGGPCAGKTKILGSLSKELEKLGYYVIVVPETASEYIRNKVIPNDTNRKHTLMFQDLMLCTQYVKEESSENYAEFIKDKHEVVILYDRAIMDNRAYLNQEDYDNLLKKYDINQLKLLDKYDLVIDLISTATAKKESYELNDTRTEPIELASARDKLTSLAWLLHRNLKVIKPTEELDDKKEIVLCYINNLLTNNQKNESVTIEVDKEKMNYDRYDDNNSKTINIKRVYLNNMRNTESNYILNKRQYNGQVSYVLDKINKDVIESSNPISREEYIETISSCGVKKIEDLDVLSFIDNGNHFRIINKEGDTYLETEFKNIPCIPDFIPVKNKDSKTLIKQLSVLR